MPVINIHERVLDAPIAKIGKLIDSLASDDDKLWPCDQWVAMKFDRPLGVGAVGGHGPICYGVESYDPGLRIQFRFIAPKGFIGIHRFEVEAMGDGRTRLRHIIEMQLRGMAKLTWPLAIRHLHDALMEDALDRAEIYAGGHPAKRNGSLWVRFLRYVMSRRETAKKK